jgi:DHA2 family methylenomycin A resistance protein-like MFS transporter
MTSSPRQAVRQPSRTAPAAGAVLVVALLGFFMISLDATAVNVALPAMGRTFGGTTAGLQWVVDGYTVPFAALLISAGAVSDRAGAKRVFGCGLAAFTAASAACGLAPWLGYLIGARMVQGGAAAVMLPASLALVRQAYADPAARARAVARWSAGAASAIAAGPVIGGVLTSAADWRTIFFVNLPVGLVALALLTRATTSPRRSVPLDLAGQAAAIVTLAALAFGVISGGASGFGRPPAAGALALAALGGATFVLAEARVAHPMVPLGMFRSGVVAACVAIGFAINAAFYGIAFVLSLYFQRVLGEPPVTAGLMFLPMTALLTVANLASARVAARSGHHVPVRAGLLASALGMLALAFAHGVVLVAVILVPVGTGLGFALPSLTFVLLEAIPAAQAGLAGGLLNASRQTGGALAVALYGALVSGLFPGSFPGSFLAGMRISMLISAALLIAGAAAALTVLRPAPRLMSPRTPRAAAAAVIRGNGSAGCNRRSSR